jgi:cation diffusion facilitator CzcD-associated flavoprotein CzcO
LQPELDVVVIGGGQAGLAVGFYLRRTPLSHVILDAQTEPGGAWLHTWRSLRLFSPARFSSLPGWVMEGGPDYYPTRDEALEYLRGYEARYELHVQRPVRVDAVRREGDLLAVESSGGHWTTRAVVSATGTWENPNVPGHADAGEFRGVQLH